MPEVEVIKKYGIYVEKNNIIYTGTNLGYCYNAGYDKYVKTDTSSIHKEYIIDILRILGSIKENNCQIPEYDKICEIFLPKKESKELKELPKKMFSKVAKIATEATSYLINKDYNDPLVYTDPLYAVNEHLRHFYKFEEFSIEYTPWPKSHPNDHKYKRRYMIKKKKPLNYKYHLISDYHQDNKNYEDYKKTKIYKLLNDFSQAAEYKKIVIEPSVNIANRNRIIKGKNKDVDNYEDNNKDVDNYEDVDKNGDVDTECYIPNKIETRNAEKWNNILEKYHKQDEEVNLAEHFYVHYCYYYFDIINEHLENHRDYYDEYHYKNNSKKVDIDHYMERFYNKFRKRNESNEDGGKRRRKKNRKTKRKNKRTKKFRKSKKKL